MVVTGLASIVEFVNLFLAFAPKPSGPFNTIFRVDVFENTQNITVNRTSFAIPLNQVEAVKLFNTNVKCGQIMEPTRCQLKDILVYDDYDGYSAIVNNGQKFLPINYETLLRGPNTTNSPQDVIKSVANRPVEVDGGIVQMTGEDGNRRIQSVNVLLRRKLLGPQARNLGEVNNDTIYSFDQCLLQRYRTESTYIKAENSHYMDILTTLGVTPPNIQHCFRTDNYLRSQFYSSRNMEFYVPLQKQPQGYRVLKSKVLVQAIIVPKPMYPHIVMLQRADFSDMQVIRVMFGCLVSLFLIFTGIEVVILHFICQLNPKYSVSLWRKRRTHVKYVMMEGRTEDFDFNNPMPIVEEPINLNSQSGMRTPGMSPNSPAVLSPNSPAKISPKAGSAPGTPMKKKH